MKRLLDSPVWVKSMVVGALFVWALAMVDVAERNEVSAENQKLLYDRMWIDRYPEMAHEEFNGFLFTADNFGLSVQAQSAFKVVLELFEFGASSQDLRFFFPHDARKQSSEYFIEELENPTKHFTHKLTISQDPHNGGQEGVYFTGPEFGSHGDLYQRCLKQAQQFSDFTLSFP